MSRKFPVILPSPTSVNSATGVSTTNSFSWTQVSGNQGYRIIVSTNINDLTTDPTQTGNLSPSNGFNITVGQNTTNYTWTGTLSTNTTYYYEVHALGSSLADAGYWSTENSFTTVTDSAALYSDTIPANTVMTPGQVFTKTWTMKNTGTSTWLSGAYGYTMNYQGGQQMSSSTYATLSSSVLPNGYGTYSLTMTAPTTPGTYTATYKMSNTRYVLFGQTVTVQIVVPVTLILYVHNGSASGPLLSGVLVTGTDGAGQGFSQTTGAGGYVTITGTPGMWQFTASDSGYTTASWSSSVTTTGQLNAFLIASLLPAPTLSGPSNGVNGVLMTPTLSWSSVTGANKYWLMVSTSQSALPTDPYATSAPGCLTAYTTNISYSSIALSNSTTYYWQVQAFNDLGNPILQGQYSSQWSFTTQLQALTPNITSVSPAQPLATNGNQNFTIYGSNFDNTAYVNLEDNGGTIHPLYGTDPVSEARHFLDVAREYLKAGYLRPVLDLERGASLGKTSLSNWVKTWINTVKSSTGIEPIIYTNSDYAQNYLDASLSQYDLWIANWTCSSSDSPPTGIWSSFSFWQYSDQGSVTGISGSVDLDFFNGDLSKLNTFMIKLDADFDRDGDIDFVDYAVFANHWGEQNCIEPNWCEGADFDHSGNVDMLDLAIFGNYWLEGTLQ